MSVLELARKLTGLKIEENSPLFQALKKLPSLEELKMIPEVKVKVSDGIDKESFGFDEKTALPDSEVNRENPLFQESSLDEAIVNLKKNAAEILERFEKLYQTEFNPTGKKAKTTGIAEIDEIRKQAFYLKFIAQECAERTAAKIALAGDFSLEEWIIVSQEIFYNTGNNITLPLTTGIRKDGKFGAGSGGLGDKISKAEFDLIFEKLKDKTLFDEDLNKLKDILIRADNVQYLEGGSKVKFLDENVEAEKTKVRAITLARETCEELFEPYVQAVLLDSKTDFVGLIEKAFGGAKITDEALSMLRQIEDKVAAINKSATKEAVMSDIAGGLKKRLSNKLVEIYKEEIEPYFARFLRISAQGKALIAEMEDAIGGDSSISYRVNDLIFPQKRLEVVAENPEKIVQPRIAISIPQSNSLVVKKVSCPMLSRLSDSTKKFIEENPDTVKSPIEYKGARYFDDSAKHLEFLLDVYVGEDNEGKPNKMAYAHEIFVQICAAMSEMSKEQAEEVFKEIKKTNPDFDKKFRARNQWLVEAQLTNLHSGKGCKNVEEVFHAMPRKSICAVVVGREALSVGDSWHLVDEEFGNFTPQENSLYIYDIFNKSGAVNERALFHQLKELYKTAKDSNILSIEVAQISQDFSIKNHILDTINFIAPALQALQIMGRFEEINDHFISSVVKNIAAKVGSKKLKMISVEDVVGFMFNEENTVEEERQSLGGLLKIEVKIPQGAIISDSGQDYEAKRVAALKEIQDAGAAQGVSFSELEIDNLEAGGSVVGAIGETLVTNGMQTTLL